MQVIVIISALAIAATAQNCIPRQFNENSIVCVCNATYCDFVEVEIPNVGSYQVYISTQSGRRLDTEIGVFESEACLESSLILELNPLKSYQTIEGFGGAFTDSVGINMQTLSEGAQEQILQSYYGRSGSRYNLGRVPVGGTDFSIRPYTLDDVPGDVTLANFSLTLEDYNYKIPYMQRALELNPETKFLSAAWTAPPWMKTNNAYRGYMGFLQKRYYQLYSEYLVKFLEAYKNAGLPIWAISTGNEPADVFVPFMPLNDMGWTPSTVAAFIVDNFGPTIANSASNETVILALDDQRVYLPWYIDDMYAANKDVDKYLAGIAVHWYLDFIMPTTLFDKTHANHPCKFIIMSEACAGSQPWDKPSVRLGSWGRGERYLSSILEDLNHWVVGWVDWNLALDKQGGPNWINNFVDSPIIVNPETDEFFKQPMYYAIAHFSKFVPRGSVRVDLTRSKRIQSAAFLTPDNNMAVVLLNKHASDTPVTIIDPDQGKINVIVPGRSFETIIYRK